MYEVITIMNPNVTNDFVETKIGDWTKIIQEFEGELHRTDRWGKKNLAYEVKKFKQGYFLLFHISGKHELIDELERRFRIADEVIRYQSVKLNDLEYKTSVELLDRMSARVSEDHVIIEEENRAEGEKPASPDEAKDPDVKETKAVVEPAVEPAVEAVVEPVVEAVVEEAAPVPEVKTDGETEPVKEEN